jgi:hypothetical protein
MPRIDAVQLPLDSTTMVFRSPSGVLLGFEKGGACAYHVSLRVKTSEDRCALIGECSVIVRPCRCLRCCVAFEERGTARPPISARLADRDIPFSVPNRVVSM